MKNYPTHAYSQLVILRGAFEYELYNVLRFRDKQEVFRVIQYLEERIEEIKEEEKECLRIQASLTK